MGKILSKEETIQSLKALDVNSFEGKPLEELNTDELKELLDNVNNKPASKKTSKKIVVKETKKSVVKNREEIKTYLFKNYYGRRKK